MIKDNDQLTISDLRHLEGENEPYIMNEKAPISKWYSSILGTRLCDLSDGDIIKLLRQEEHLQYIIPLAIKRIENNPLAGFYYDCELLAALSEIRRNIWSDNLTFKERAKELIKKLEGIGFAEKHQWDFDSTKEDYISFLSRLKISIDNA